MSMELIKVDQSPEQQQITIPDVLPVLPLSGYVALQFAERFDRVWGATRAFAILVLRRRAFLRLTAERHDIQNEIAALGREVDALYSPSNSASGASRGT